jgi:hypothetical protein
MNAAKRLAIRGWPARAQSGNSKGGRSWRSLKEKDETLAMYVGQHQVVWRSARDQVEALEQALEVQKTPFAEQLERLQTVPGVGPIVATTAVAVFSDIRRFPTAKHAASYSGVVPSTHQSGDRDAHGRITKKGSGDCELCCAKRLITRRAPIIRQPLLPKPRAKRVQNGRDGGGASALSDLVLMLKNRRTSMSRIGSRRGPAHRAASLPPQGGHDRDDQRLINSERASIP